MLPFAERDTAISTTPAARHSTPIFTSNGTSWTVAAPPQRHAPPDRRELRPVTVAPSSTLVPFCSCPRILDRTTSSSYRNLANPVKTSRDTSHSARTQADAPNPILPPPPSTSPLDLTFIPDRIVFAQARQAVSRAACPSLLLVTAAPSLGVRLSCR